MCLVLKLSTLLDPMPRNNTNNDLYFEKIHVLWIVPSKEANCMVEQFPPMSKDLINMPFLQCFTQVHGSLSRPLICHETHAL